MSEYSAKRMQNRQKSDISCVSTRNFSTTKLRAQIRGNPDLRDGRVERGKTAGQPTSEPGLGEIPAKAAFAFQAKLEAGRG
ncbi:MAG: hypothetical protein K0M60_14110 [Hydrogenophaga sp.]|nr:hypothetical protein [Hydrogenophaga sp.]